MFPLAPMVIIGMSLNENLFSEGVFASSGKSLIIALIFRCASFMEISTLALEVNVMDTTERLS